MEVRVKFAGGPMDGHTALVDGLDPIRVFFNDEDRRVIVYFRADELLYVIDHAKSVKLSETFDEVKQKIVESTPPSSIRWDSENQEEPLEEDQPLPPETFSDTPIDPDTGEATP